MLSVTDQTRILLSRSAPSLLLLLVVVISGTPFLFSIQSMPQLYFSWMVIYYWALFRPTVLPFIILFASGLMQDIMLGMPLGLSALAFLLIRLCVTSLRRFITAHQFWVVWGGFAILALLLVAMHWLVMDVFFDHQASFVSMLLSAALNWIIYPLCHVGCNVLYAKLPTLQLRSHSL